VNNLSGEVSKTEQQALPDSYLQLCAS